MKCVAMILEKNLAVKLDDRHFAGILEKYQVVYYVEPK